MVQNFQSWYEVNKCGGAPHQPIRLVNLTYKIWEDDYSETVQQAELDNLTISALNHCFQNFDASRGNQEKSVEDRFVGFYHHQLKFLLRDKIKGEKTKDRKQAVINYLVNKKYNPPKSERVICHKCWCQFLLDKALLQTDRELQKFVKLRYFQNKNIEEVSRLMKVSRQTLYNKYRFEKLVHILKGKIKKMIAEISRKDLKLLIYVLYIMEEFSKQEISNMLNIPLKDIEEISMESMGELIDNIEADSGMKIFG